MRARTLIALLALLLAAPLAAQEQRGTIEGIVRDTSGAVLPGVTVEAKSPSGAMLTTVSDATGVYRFPSVAPGTYTISAALAAFAPGRTPDVVVGLGQVKKVDFQLGLAGVAESVQVTAESPIVDVRQSARQTNISAEQVTLLPRGRDFTTLVTQATGANDEAKLGGLSIDGASASENRYIIDGMETTDLVNGVSGKLLSADFVEEVQVKSSGYTAEFGGATGGVVSVVTKSGTNDWHGSALANYDSDLFQAGRTPTLRISLANAANAEYITYPEDTFSHIEPGFSIGGPIVRNKAWFFGAYQPSLLTTKRTVNNQPEVTQHADTHYLTATQTAQLTDSIRTRLAYNNSWGKTRGLLPALNGTDPVGTNYSKESTFPNYTFSGNLDWVASPKLFFGIRGGYYMSDQHDSNVTEEVRYIFLNTSNTGIPGVPLDLQHPSNFTNIPSNFKVTRNQQTRAYFQADGTVYANLAGAHQLKFGVQADRVGNNVLSGESKPRVNIRWGSSLSTGVPVTSGAYGYYSVRNNAADPTQGFVTEGNIHTVNLGLFLQDAWTINNRLTVNAGVRTERERVPTYTVGQDVPKFGIEFGFKDKLAPRAGFAYDIKGDGRWKAFGSWGVFYDIFKLQLPQGSFGGQKWLEYYYTLDTYDWPNIAQGANCPPACAGTLIRGPIDFRHPSFGADSIEPNLKPMRQQEATFGVDHQLNDVMAVSAHYVHKQLDRAIEDTGSLDAAGNEIYIVANPGEGLTKIAYPGVDLPKAKRDYDGVEFAFEKRFAHRWYLRSSYLWSRLYGNYSGLSESDENGRTNPNVGRLFDYPIMMFTENGQPSVRPARHGSAAPVQDPVHLLAALRHDGRAERVPGERPAGNARCRRTADQQLPGPVSRARQRRADGRLFPDGPPAPAPVRDPRQQAASTQPERAEPVQPARRHLEVHDPAAQRRHHVQ